jgi:DNA cross-link repair 1A protein
MDLTSTWTSPRQPFFRRKAGFAVMRLEDLPFEVDRFVERPGRTVVPRFTLLTHAHADHLLGLSTESYPPVYCTASTAALASLRTGAPASRFKHISFKVPTKVYADDSPREHVATVTALSANHCFGAAMFVVDGSFGRVLHTGDFRYGGCISRDIRPYIGTVDQLLLDCTYCHPSFDFPSQVLVLQQIVTAVTAAWQRGAGDDIFIGGDTLGKEELYVAIAKECETRVLVDRARYQTIAAADSELASKYFLTLPAIPPRSHLLSIPNSYHGSKTGLKNISAMIHVVPWWTLSPKLLSAWEAKTGRRAKAIIPTACPSRLLSDTVRLHVPYSAHSSFSELREFVRYLRPSRLGPTPETSQYTAKDGLCRDPSMWFEAECAISRDPAHAIELTTQLVSESSKKCGQAHASAEPILAGGAFQNRSVPSESAAGFEVSPNFVRLNRTAAKRRRRLRSPCQEMPSKELLKLMQPGLRLPTAKSLTTNGNVVAARQAATSDLPSESECAYFSNLDASVPRDDKQMDASFPKDVGLVDKNGNFVSTRLLSVWF